MASKQCEATVQTEDLPTFGQQCSRLAVTGADFCSQHGGVEQKDADLAAIRKRIDRPRKQCSFTKKNGEPCKNFAIHGTTVCKAHGGNLPNVRKKAKERLLGMVDPALGELQAILEKKSTSDADKLRAIAMVLNRTGYHEKSEMTVEHEVKPWEGLVAGVLRDVPEKDAGIVHAELIDDNPPADSAERSEDAEGVDEDDDPRAASLPSDEAVEAVKSQILAEWGATQPTPEPEPDRSNVTKIWSRPNPPSHLR